MTQQTTISKPRGQQCLCSVCGEMFGTERAFDMHRTGAFGKHPAERRCLSSDAMREKKMGWNEKRGHWMTTSRPMPFAAHPSRARGVMTENRELVSTEKQIDPAQEGEAA